MTAALALVALAPIWHLHRVTTDAELDALEAAARAFMREVESPDADDPYGAMLGAVATLLGLAARRFDLANEPGAYLEDSKRPAVAEATWSPTPALPDEFRQTMHAVYRDEYGREEDVKKESVRREIADLYAAIAPLVRALDGGVERRLVLRTLASELGGPWGQTAAWLVRPLWELAGW